MPIALPSGRNGFQPQLTLAYSTGNGNGPFGLGWSLSIPGVSRLTSKGIPRYQGNDVFVLSGAEDLVPLDDADPRHVRYRPRTEGLFARILRHCDDATDHWEVNSKDGLTSFYGTPGALGGDPAVVADPVRRDHVFGWKLTETRDPFGNRILYHYLRDAGRDDMHHWDQLYLNRIQYADYFDDTGKEQFLVSVEIHYGERQDAFSEYRSSFEIRTRLRAERIAVHIHHDGDEIVRRYDLIYLDRRTDLPNLASLIPLNGVSLLSRVIVTGIDKDGVPESMPPLDFGYSQFDPRDPKRRDLLAVEGESLPPGHLGKPGSDLVDLTADGLPDVIEMNGVVRYWKNVGAGRFDPPRTMSRMPSVQLGAPGIMMIDADGNGRADLLASAGGLSGYYSLDSSGEWSADSFQRYPAGPTFTLNDPEVRLIDLDGDGVTDAVRTGTRLEHYFMNKERGWDPQSVASMEYGPRETFPNVRFSDPRVKVGDMTGDGLQDIIQVGNRRVEYWPNNCGDGRRWGRIVSMRNAPQFDDTLFPLGFDPRRVIVCDVDGDGLADILYIEDGRVRLWINQGGNGWSPELIVTGTPAVTNADAVRAVDLLGSGVAGVLFSRDLEPFGLPQHLFLDLTGGGKPYLLTSMDNHMGAQTEVAYASSTKFLLADSERPGTRWRTTLPFPVHVVHKVAVTDAISRTRLTTTYTYHHGYWSGIEREFRGFSRVEQRNAELNLGDGVPAEQIGVPLLTKTWFHLGAVASDEDDPSELDLTYEYWNGDPARFEQHPSISRQPILAGMPRRARRDLLRSLRGSVLRTELYAEDGTPLASLPYTITENRYAVQEIEPPAHPLDPRTRIFSPHQLAQRTTQWERGDDPMTSMTFTDGYDDFGQPTRQTTVALPRRSRRRASANGVTLDEPRILATHARTHYVNPPAIASVPYIADRVSETERFELAAAPEFDESDPNDVHTILADQIDKALEIHTNFMDGANSHRTGHVRNYYDGKSFIGLALGQIGRHGALTRSETLVVTDQELDNAYSELRPDYLNGPMTLPAGAPATNFASLGYQLEMAGAVRQYYMNTLRQANDVQDGVAAGRGLTVAVRDVFDHATQLQHDAYALFPEQVIDPVGLVTAVAYNYRVMQPERITDPNGNASVMRFTLLGLPRSMFLNGQNGEGGGDGAEEVTYEYDFISFDDRREPISVTIYKRTHHASQKVSNATIRTTDYSDGFGRQIQSRRQAEHVIFGDPVFGNDVVPGAHGDTAADRRAIVGVENTDKDNPNVVVSGWQRYDNIGRVIEKYEPFFDTGWDYDALHDAPRGQAIRMFYDPRGHLIRTANPDGSEQRVLFGIPRALDTPDDFRPTPWESFEYDANDLATVTADPDTGATHSTDAPATHHFTPPSSVIDAMGRTLASVQRNGPNENEWIITRSNYDARGNLLAIIDALGRLAFQHAYDLLDRPLHVNSIDAGLRTTVLNALGAPVEYRDSKGALALRFYTDALNRLTHLWARDNDTSTLTLREVLTYGDNGTVSQSRADRQAARDKNQLARLIQHDDEAGRCTYRQYDFKGNPTEKVRVVISDAALAAGWEPDWSQPNAGAARDPIAYETSMQFDALNRPIHIFYPADVNNHRARLAPRYNRAGALEQITLDNEVYVERLAYNARGQRSLLAYGNNMVTRYAYDERTFRLTRLRTQRCNHPDALSYQPNGNVRQDYAYSYDLVGNILGIDEQVKECGVSGSTDVDRLLRQFEYDPFYRLRRATGRETDGPPPAPPWVEFLPYNSDSTRTRAYIENYGYDLAGNIISLGRSTAGSRTYTPEAASNRLRTMTVGGVPSTNFSYAYDPNGNMIGEATSRRFFWDHVDRMKRFEEGPVRGSVTLRARYIYGPDGQRVKKWVRKGNSAANDESTVYIDGFFEHHRWHDAGNKQNNHLHVVDGQSRIAIVRVGDNDTRDGSEPVQYHCGDHLGSNSVVIGGANAQANNSVSREEYTAYGETSFGSFARKRYRFGGKEKEESGFYYYGARYLAQWLGKWISPDPSGYRSGINLTEVNHLNPMRFKDPDGRDPAEALRAFAANDNVETARNILRVVPPAAVATAAPGALEAVAAAASAAAAPLAIAGAVILMVAVASGAPANTGGANYRRDTRAGYAEAPKAVGTSVSSSSLTDSLVWQDRAQQSSSDRKKPIDRPLVNIDASTVESAVTNPIERLRIAAYLSDKIPVMTVAARQEALQNIERRATPEEAATAYGFLSMITSIPNDPREDYANLRVTRKLKENDKIVFGTGAKLNIVTTTSDDQFVRSATAQGVVPDVWLHGIGTYSGRELQPAQERQRR